MAGEGRDGMEELIPENSTLARRIRAAASKGTLSHAAILSGSGDRMAAARYFAPHWSARERGSVPACGAASAARYWRTSTPTW